MWRTGFRKKKNPAGQTVVLHGWRQSHFCFSLLPQANMVKESPITHQLNALLIHKDASKDFLTTYI